jgi:hypothetical protein
MDHLVTGKASVVETSRLVELIEAQAAWLPPEARELWEQLELLRESVPGPAESGRMAGEYEVMERIFRLPMAEQFATSRLAELLGGLRAAEEARRRGESGDEHLAGGVIGAAMLKDRQEGRPTDPYLSPEQAIEWLKE